MRQSGWPGWILPSILGICFSSLMTACSEQQQAGTDSQTSAGEYSYEVHCAECHEQPHPDLLKQPPDLHGILSRKTLPSGAPVTDEEVRKTIMKAEELCLPSTRD